MKHDITDGIEIDDKVLNVERQALRGRVFDDASLFYKNGRSRKSITQSLEKRLAKSVLYERNQMRVEMMHASKQSDFIEYTCKECFYPQSAHVYKTTMCVLCHSTI